MKEYILPSIKIRELQFETPLLTDSRIGQTEPDQPADASEHRQFWGSVWGDDED